jgi:hypothetical protein
MRERAMSDRAKVIAGLVIFVALVAFPLWYPLGAAGDRRRPELELPEDEEACIEETEYMTASHMDLLIDWRDAVVREGRTEYTASSGRQFEMSLTRTCLSCHTDRETFCNRCHDYADVDPTCWDCHVDLQGG